MYKTIWNKNSFAFDRLLSDAEKDGFTVVSFTPRWFSSPVLDENGNRIAAIFTALLHKPDTAPAMHMTTEQYLAARTPMERLADTADEVLREEARRYGDGK